MPISNDARRAECRAELAVLRDDVGRWLDRRRARDARGQYESQLRAIEDLVRDAADRLAAAVDAIDPQRPAGEVFDACRAADARALWLRRAWEFFREKFDQRDDPDLAPTLAAADEVVWSCYRQPFAIAEAIDPAVRHRTAPLPYLEARLAPEAYPRDLVPAGLLAERDAFLRDLLNALPIPVLRLPHAAARAPWWLVLVAHEAGHHVQHDLAGGPAGGPALVGAFRGAVMDAAAAAGADDAGAERWGDWSEEVFADVLSVLLVGPPAVWAIEDLELGDAAAMARRRGSYPPAAVRVTLLARAAGRAVGEPVAVRPEVAAAAARPEVAADLAVVDAVLDAAFGALPGVPAPLRELCDARADDHAPGGTVAQWRDALRGTAPRAPENDLRTARLVAAAAAGTRGDADPAALARRTFRLIVDCAEEGTRAGAGPALPDEGTPAGVRLAELLLATPAPPSLT